MISIARPTHNKYALHSLNNETYIKFVNGYSTAKKLGVKGVWLYISGSGVKDLCTEALRGHVRKWGRRKLGTAIIGAGTYIITPVVPFVTNSTKIIKAANMTHTAITYIAETCEDCTNLAWLPLDLLLCGQAIPIGEAGRYNLMEGDWSLFDNIG